MGVKCTPNAKPSGTHSSVCMVLSARPKSTTYYAVHSSVCTYVCIHTYLRSFVRLIFWCNLAVLQLVSGSNVTAPANSPRVNEYSNRFFLGAFLLRSVQGCADPPSFGGWRARACGTKNEALPVSPTKEFYSLWPENIPGARNKFASSPRRNFPARSARPQTNAAPGTALRRFDWCARRHNLATPQRTSPANIILSVST